MESIACLTKLSHLDAAENNIFRINPLFELKKLVYLKLIGNPVTTRRDYRVHLQTNIGSVIILDPKSIKPYSKYHS